MASHRYKSRHGRTLLRSERGAVLLVVIILSTIALAVMTTVLYIVTVGTQITGMEKRYRTALEAGFGGWDVTRRVIEYQSDSASINNFITLLNTSTSMDAEIKTPNECESTSGTIYQGLATKLMAPMNTWSASCSSSLTIDTAATDFKTPNSYDMLFTMGSTTSPSAYRVYAKIVHHQQGNTASGYGEGTSIKGGVISSSGELEVPESPAFYTVEIDSENITNPNERAKLSVLYQY